LRDADGDGVAEIQRGVPGGLNQPFGMALLGDTFYVGNTDGVVAFPYAAGASRITAPGAESWPRSSPAGIGRAACCRARTGGSSTSASARSSNIAENGMAAEEGRAAIYELDLASGKGRIFAGGLRNPVGLAWEPSTGVLWTVVNERDGLGDETPPDYLTSVRDGGFYGWPYCYWGQTVDDRVPQDAAAGRDGHHAGLRAGRAHRLARPVLAARRHASRLSGRHGDRPARLLEPQHAERLQAGLRAVSNRRRGRLQHLLSRGGRAGAPKLLLLHGFPSASHMFRDLIPLLADRFHIVAPDLPGFGKSDMPGRGHTFDKIAETIDRFTEVVGFDRYAVYVFDYGAPTGFRLAVKHPGPDHGDHLAERQRL
jgi:hypothetical protein